MILLNGKRIDSTIGDALPIGTLSPFVGLVAPKGYLICMGQLVDKAKYPELWELCGDTFGPSTTTQFYLPDLRGVTIAGYKQGDATFGTLGALIGGLTHTHTTGNHTLTTTEMPKHSHTRGTMNITGTFRFQDDADNAGVDASASGTGAISGVNGSGSGSSVASTGWSIAKGFDFNAANSWTGATSIEGGDGAHNHGDTGSASNIQPTAVMNWIIKASMIAVIESNIEDSLTSTSSTDALSAKQGKVLKDLVDTNNVLAFKKSAIKTVQKRLTTDVAGNGALGMSPGNEIILSIYQLGTDANCWVTLYCYDGIYFVHTGNWDGSAFSGTATFEIVYIDRNDL